MSFSVTPLSKEHGAMPPSCSRSPASLAVGLVIAPFDFWTVAFPDVTDVAVFSRF